mmetsp:Transcript_10554/g.22352  ORF Transcript_10554/g.22352 Transcript_10554/m.22352 type:complete len:225 (-) Transcript_10554:87-761(-)
MAVSEGWIEVFYSNTSWKKAFVVYKKNGAKEWSEPEKMIPAEHIRETFKVFRIKAANVEFYITNGAKTFPKIEDCWGQMFKTDHSGRYVVQNGGALKQVGEADVFECERAASSENEQYIEVLFSADLWEECFMVYGKNGEPFTEPPGSQMDRLPNGQFAFRIEAKSLVFALNDGGDVWDNNNENNYRIGYPGKYLIRDGKPNFISSSDADTKGVFSPVAPVSGM